MRIVVIGDELAAGLGDARYLGWVGRVMARSQLPEPAFIANLALPAVDTTQLAHGWRTEAESRISHREETRLVVGLGIGDVRSGLSAARSRLNLANILDGATESRIPAFVVGPPPLTAPGDIAELSAAYADVCQRRSVPYVHTYAPLSAHEQWHADIAQFDGKHPGQIGYGLLAWLVLNQGWESWISPRL
ncbi:GDSL-type esterase/lipase family protein [Bowdeniella massiliensis]|uniref:GDSL-type esterase/lipase family protein n=1 Tax=Bowdeniella massiliensis TaxID=2932264 RepID=UPI002027F5A6|nr:GDSL-type esterase/lipase family protein [Bowdeniella massiliensis]